MEIETKGRYIPQAGDILSWIDGRGEILFAVINNKTDKIIGITIRDNRGANHKPHIVIFTVSWKLALLIENDGENIEDNLSDTIQAWDIE